MTDTRTEDLDETTNAYLDALAEAEKLKARTAELAAHLLDLLGDHGRHEITGLPGVGVYVMPAQLRFKAARAEAVLTPEQLATISVPKPEAALAKAVLHPALYGQLVEPTKPSLRSM